MRLAFRGSKGSVEAEHVVELGLRRLEADVDPRNLSSLRLLEKLGFQREGFMRERWALAGELQDAVFLALLRREWVEIGGGRRPVTSA